MLVPPYFYQTFSFFENIRNNVACHRVAHGPPSIVKNLIEQSMRSLSQCLTVLHSRSILSALYIYKTFFRCVQILIRWTI